ncbi:cysteine--1-D-myo-inosityl 2-amino-2-deoxy-alpha-D-glucopyranoside ligase [Agilicoccus flavus]|uniref:cysteine--1-D-myo-inosityl 2-amino-2-deoxy-alpha-D-glucopyranoside ligase n=1 Tax=Agilicoccus flavus TaxID=2775968 RepID=UPI001CF6F7F1|nr:cysteine--1-D-myo-inosityl 2-amino-2-deoxy-alpha-D-glucopyranoside ligase [Agilicoccus flavus]
MNSWPSPPVPALPGRGGFPVVHDSASGGPRTIRPEGDTARLYVCGITPYDATHLGHAATYVTFDVLGRVLRDAGVDVDYVQNVTDVDDPLLERAQRDGLDWRELAAREIQLFRDDMSALRVLAPRAYVGVVERIAGIGADVRRLLDSGAAYLVPNDDAVQADSSDVYLDVSARPDLGGVSGWTREQMLEVYADRGGDPDRPGKRDALDPLLWRAARPGEPSWEVDGLPAGRPGWHIECTYIAAGELGPAFDVQGGGIDLVFPHHEMSAVQADALDGGPFARAYVHQEMVGLDGHKMSKSRGNLVLVSKLRAGGVDPAAIRLVLLGQHYRTPWEWTDDLLRVAENRLAAWREGVDRIDEDAARALLAALRERLADDLDTAGALAAVDAAVAAAPGAGDGSDAASRTSGSGLTRDALDALLGVRP